jgi:hypothetical protein
MPKRIILIRHAESEGLSISVKEQDDYFKKKLFLILLDRGFEPKLV